MDLPDADIAADIAASAVGQRPTRIDRFTTGTQHYVFEASFEGRAPVVVRIAAQHSRDAMASASRWSRRLRPLGVKLPKIIAEDLTGPFAYLVLERLEGRDLGAVVAQLGPPQLEAIATQIVAMQKAAARTGSTGRYGYSPDAASAPYQRWSDVLEAGLARTRTRMAVAKLFDVSLVDRFAETIDGVRRVLDAMPALPFLHDTTTKNVIVASDGTLSGIVDIDDLCYGDARYVVALTLASLRNLGVSSFYTDTWMRLAGFAKDRIFRLYVAQCLLDFMSEHGQVFNGNVVQSSPEERARLQGLFAQAYDQALGT